MTDHTFKGWSGRALLMFAIAAALTAVWLVSMLWSNSSDDAEAFSVAAPSDEWLAGDAGVYRESRADVALPDAAQSMAPEEGLPNAALPIQAGEVLATDVAQAYREPTEALLVAQQGSRMRMVGRVLDSQSMDGGMVLVQLDAGSGLPPLRLVVAAAPNLPADASAWTRHPWQFDCLHGGAMMGEPIFSDCRLEPR